MKKKYIIIGAIVVIFGALSIWLLTRPESLGNIKHTYSKPETGVSNISFLGEANERIKFSFRSNIESGDLDIILYDSEGNEAYKLDKAKALETSLDLDNSGTYTLAAEYKNFIGSFKITVYKLD